MVTLLDAVKMAYRKHHLDDPSIGWDELSDVLMMALCNEMGDQGFQNWLHQVSAQQSVQRTARSLRLKSRHPKRSSVCNRAAANANR